MILVAFLRIELLITKKEQPKYKRIEQDWTYFYNQATPYKISISELKTRIRSLMTILAIIHGNILRISLETYRMRAQDVMDIQL